MVALGRPGHTGQGGSSRHNTQMTNSCVCLLAAAVAAAHVNKRSAMVCLVTAAIIQDKARPPARDMVCCCACMPPHARPGTKEACVPSLPFWLPLPCCNFLYRLMLKLQLITAVTLTFLPLAVPWQHQHAATLVTDITQAFKLVNAGLYPWTWGNRLPRL